MPTQLALNVAPMSAIEFQLTIAAIGWPPAEIARRLDISERNARRMADGARPVKPEVAVWLRECLAIVRTVPAKPAGWGRRFPRLNDE